MEKEEKTTSVESGEQGVLIKVKEKPFADIFKWSRKFDTYVLNDSAVVFDHQTGEVKTVPVEQTEEGKSLLGIIHKKSGIMDMSEDLLRFKEILAEAKKVMKIDFSNEIFANQYVVRGLIETDISSSWIIPKNGRQMDISDIQERFMSEIEAGIEPQEYGGSTTEQEPKVIKKAEELANLVRKLESNAIQKPVRWFESEISEGRAVTFIAIICAVWRKCRLGMLLIDELLKVFPLEEERAPGYTGAIIIDEILSKLQNRVTFTDAAKYTERTGMACGVKYSDTILRLFDPVAGPKTVTQAADLVRNEVIRLELLWNDVDRDYKDMGVMMRCYVQHLSAAHIIQSMNASYHQLLKEKIEYYARTLSFNMFYEEVHPKLEEHKRQGKSSESFPDPYLELMRWLHETLMAVGPKAFAPMEPQQHPWYSRPNEESTLITVPNDNYKLKSVAVSLKKMSITSPSTSKSDIPIGPSKFLETKQSNNKVDSSIVNRTIYVHYKVPVNRQKGKRIRLVNVYGPIETRMESWSDDQMIEGLRKFVIDNGNSGNTVIQAVKWIINNLGFTLVVDDPFDRVSNTQDKSKSRKSSKRSKFHK